MFEHLLMLSDYTDLCYYRKLYVFEFSPANNQCDGFELDQIWFQTRN